MTASGTSACARSCERAALAFSASSRPVLDLPAASSASNLDRRAASVSAPRVAQSTSLIAVTLITSSGEVMPSSMRRWPSSRIERNPAASAATKSWLSAARLWISARTLSSATISSYTPVRPL